MRTEDAIAMVFMTGILGGVIIIFLGIRQRTAQLEMRHRERMAMIERGLIPLETPAHAGSSSSIIQYQRNSRFLSAGIIVIGIGLALAMIIGFAGESPEIAVGVGGAIAVIGAAFVVRSMVVRPEPPSPQPPPSETP